jgi:hypothetical protein
MTGTQKWLLARVAKSDPIWHDNCISIILKLFKSPPEENAPQLIPQLVGLFMTGMEEVLLTYIQKNTH